MIDFCKIVKRKFKKYKRNSVIQENKKAPDATWIVKRFTYLRAVICAAGSLAGTSAYSAPRNQ